MFITGKPLNLEIIASDPGSVNDEMIADPSCVADSQWRASAMAVANVVLTGVWFAPVTDQPYGMNYKINARSWNNEGLDGLKPFRMEKKPGIIGDDQPFDPAPFLVYRKVAFFGANKCAHALPAGGRWIVWDKRRDSKPDDHSDCELVWTNVPGADRIHRQKWRGIVREGEENISRSRKPMSDARFAQVLDSITSDIIDGPQGPVTASRGGRPMLANQRDMARFFSWKDAESWQAIADAVGTNQSVLETMTNHIKGMADDIAALRVLGPNPEATKAFIHGLLDREAARLGVKAPDAATPAQLAAATKANKAIESRIRLEKRLFDDLYAEVKAPCRSRIFIKALRSTRRSVICAPA